MALWDRDVRCPFQRLETCHDKLLVARMGSIHTYTYDKTEDKFKYLWTWKTFDPTGAPPSPVGSALPEDVRNEDGLSKLAGLDVLDEVLRPPAKRRRLEEVEDSSKTTSHSGSNQDNETDGKADGPLPGGKSETARYSRVISCMKVTGDYAVATTYHDKAIWVFKVHPTGRLEVLSQRIMPKRPIAIDILGGDTIISADKFGDVYSLPLLLSTESDNQPKEPAAVTPTASKPTTAPLAATVSSDGFRPQANELTVHSQRNLRALESQKHEAERRQKQKQKPQQPASATTGVAAAAAFDGTLLLGHVSMLTSVVAIQHGKRTYVATADRDAHVRLSRGPPQAHVTEAYLLAHRAFVSRLAVVRAAAGTGGRPLLVSGGGESTLFVWDVVGSAGGGTAPVQRLDLGEQLRGRRTVAVNGLYPVAMPGSDGGVRSDVGLFVTFEGVPALFFFPLDSSNIPELAFNPTSQTYALPGPPLAVTVFTLPSSSAESLNVAVSVDLRGASGDLQDTDSTIAATEEQRRQLRRYEWMAAEGRWEFRGTTGFDMPLPERDVSSVHLLDEALAVEPLRKREDERE